MNSKCIKKEKEKIAADYGNKVGQYRNLSVEMETVEEN